MPIPERYLIPPRTVQPGQSARDAARAMEDHHIGSLVVVDAGGSPVGMVTDRDLALYVLVSRRPPEECRVQDCMSRPAVTLPIEASLAEASQEMRRNGIRRLPLVDARGRLVGILTGDDLVALLGDELAQLAQAVQRGFRNERQPLASGSSIFGRE